MVEEEEEINNNKCKKCAIDYEKLSREQLLMVVHDFHQKLEESKEEYLKLSVIYQKTLLDDEKKSLEKFDHRSVQTSPTLHPILPIIRSSSPLPSIIAPPLSNPPPIIDSNNRSSSTADLDRLTRELKEMMMIQMKMQSELQQVRKAEGLSLINSSSSLSTPHSHLIMNNNNSNNNNNNNASSTSTDYYSNHSLLYNGTGPEGLSSYHHHHHFDDPEPGMS